MIIPFIAAHSAPLAPIPRFSAERNTPKHGNGNSR